jgi:hypothetical protein
MPALPKHISGGLDTDTLYWSDAPWGNTPPPSTELDLNGATQATAGLFLPQVTQPNYANFNLVDGHTIDFDVLGVGTLTGNLKETVTVSATSGLDSHGNLVGSIYEQIKINASITDGTFAALLKVTDTINLTLTGSGYTGGGAATAIAEAVTQANGQSEPNGQNVQTGSGVGQISSAKITVTGAPSWELTVLSKVLHGATLHINGSEKLDITAGWEDLPPSKEVAQTTNLSITASDTGIIGVITDPAAHHTLTLTA